MPGKSPFSMMQPPKQRARETAAGAHGAAPTLAHLGARRGRHFVAGLWSCLWYVSASVAERALAGWVEREPRRAVLFVRLTNDRGISVDVSAQCTDATAEIKNSQPPYTVRAKGSFAAEVYRPTRLIGKSPNRLRSRCRRTAEYRRLDSSASRRARHASRSGTRSLEFSALDLGRANGGESLFNAKRADFHGRIAEVATRPSGH